MDLEEALRDLAPRTVRYCRLRTGAPDLGDEVAQEALAALVLRWRTYGPPDSPAAFVFAIARRRTARAIFRRSLLAPLDVLAGARDGHRSPEDAVMAREEHDRIRAALSKLRRRERETMLLMAAGDLTTAEAARVLRVSASAIKMRMLRARQRMAALLGDGNGRRPAD